MFMAVGKNLLSPLYSTQENETLRVVLALINNEFLLFIKRFLCLVG